MNRLVSALVALIASCVCVTAVQAAVPLVLWDGDFREDGQQVTKDGITYTLHLNGNTIETAEDGSTYILIGNSAHGTAGVTVDVSPVPTTNLGGTMVVKFSHAGYGDDEWGTLMTLCCDKADAGYTNITSLTVGDANGTLHGQWGEGYWSDRTSDGSINDTTIPLDGTVCNLAMTYIPNGGTRAYRRTGDDGWTDAYVLGGYGGGTYNMTGFSVGGPHTQPCGRTTDFSTGCRPIPGMKIYAIAYVPVALTDVTSMAAFVWSRDIRNFTTTVPVQGEVDWSAIQFDADWVSSLDACANITLAGDATITLPEDFVANTLNFTGNYNVALVSGGTTIAPVQVISGEATVVRLIPAGYADALTIPAGQTYRIEGATAEDATVEYAQVFTVNGTLETTGNVRLSGANTVSGAGARLDVKSGTAHLNFAGCGVTAGGTLVVEKGATAVALSTDAGNYNGTFTVSVYGTLDLDAKRWTIKGGTLELYGDAVVKGSGDANGAVDLWSVIATYPVDGEQNTAVIQAPIKWTSDGAVVSVSDGCMLTIESMPKNNQTRFTKRGTGTLRLAAGQRLGGVQQLVEGTLEFACTNAIAVAGTVNSAMGTTLKVSDGAYDVSNYVTILGTLEVAGGTVTVSGDATYTIEVTGGTLKVAVSDVQWADGCTLGDNFAVPEGVDVIFVNNGTEVTGSGRTLGAQGLRWVGGASGAWNVAGNWSNGAVPSATDNVILDAADAVVAVAAEDVAPAAVIVRADTRLTGTFTNFGSATIENGATLTVEGTGSIAGVQGGTFVKEGAGELRIGQNGATGFSLQDVTVVIREGSLDTQGAFKDLDLTIADGATIKHSGWASGCVGTLTLSCEGEVSAFANSGGSDNNIKISGFASVIKKGVGTMTVKAAFESPTIDIQEGKLILDTPVNQTEGNTVITGSGAFEMAAGTAIPASALANFEGSWPTTGVIKCGATPPTSETLLAKLREASWTGVVSFVNWTNMASFDPNLYGNENSVVRLQGCEGYFREAKSAPYMTVLPTIDFVNGGNNAGMKVNNGWSGDRIQFRKVTGAGAFALYPSRDNGAPSQRYFLEDVSAYTGRVEMQSRNGNGTSAIFFGKDWTGYAESGNAYDGTVFVAGDMQQANMITNGVGKIIVQEGVTAKMAATARWTASQIEVRDTGVLDVVTTGNLDDTSTVYTNFVGTGTVRYSGAGWHAVPVSTNIWSDTLGFCLEQPEGALLTQCGTADEPFVYACGSLSGTGDIRVDYTDVANSRSLRVTQSRNTEWSGKVSPCTNSTRDRFHSLIVAGAGGAAEKTLTISGVFDAQCPNNLVIEPTGSVNLTGDWVGDVAVEGELTGTGSATGTITFGPEATLVCTPGETSIGGTLALAEDASALRLALASDSALTERTYQLFTLRDGQTLPAVVWVNAADYPRYKLKVDGSGARLIRDGFSVIIR